MKVYFWLSVTLLFVALVPGLFLPALFSAKSDIAVGLGILSIFVFPVIVYFLILKIKKSYK